MSPGVIANSVIAGITTVCPATSMGMSATSAGSGALLKSGVGAGVGTGDWVGTTVASPVGLGTGVGLGVGIAEQAMSTVATTIAATIPTEGRAASGRVIGMGAAMIAPLPAAAANGSGGPGGPRGA